MTRALKFAAWGPRDGEDRQSGPSASGATSSLIGKRGAPCRCTARTRDAHPGGWCRSCGCELNAHRVLGQVALSGRHCCACERICFHVGSPTYCGAHRPKGEPRCRDCGAGPGKCWCGRDGARPMEG